MSTRFAATRVHGQLQSARAHAAAVQSVDDAKNREPPPGWTRGGNGEGGRVSVSSERGTTTDARGGTTRTRERGRARAGPRADPRDARRGNDRSGADASREIAIRVGPTIATASARSILATESERDGGRTRTSRVSTRVRGPRVGPQARTALCPRTDHARHLYPLLHVQESRAAGGRRTTRILADTHHFMCPTTAHSFCLALALADSFLYPCRVLSTHRVMLASLNTGGRGEPTARLVYRC